MNPNELDRAADNETRRYIERVMHRSCIEAAKATALSGDALLIWMDGNGEFQARRINREASVLRDWTPPYIARRG